MSSDPCLKMLEAALMIVRKNLDELASQPKELRVGKYGELRRGQMMYEDTCAPRLMFDARVLDLGYFQLARLKLAGSFMLRQPESVEEVGIREVVEEFTEDEYDILSRLDRYARLDFLTKEEIASALFNKQGQIYGIVKQWYDEQMDEFDRLVNPLEAKAGIKEYVAVALRQEYRDRFEKIRAGIVEYIRIDPGAPRRLFSEYEAVLRRLIGTIVDKGAGVPKDLLQEVDQILPGDLKDLKARIGKLIYAPGGIIIDRSTTSGIERVLSGVEEGAVKAEREIVKVTEAKPAEKESHDELDRRIEEGLKKIREAKKE